MTLTAVNDEEMFYAVRSVVARRRYDEFFLMANQTKEAKMYPHTKLITDKLQKIIDGEQHFYIVEMPPQHGKSMTITETFPAYYLMRNPDKSVMVTAYSQDLYTRFARANRRHFADYAELFDLQVGKNTSNDFDVAGHDGEAYFTSILGGGTGRPADLLIIDDPIKDSKEARSQTVKDSIWDEWTQTFSTRLHRGGSVIVIMTRWQTDDLAGRLLEKMDYPWEEIKLPAISHDLRSNETDAIGRHNGEALCPALHPLSDLLAHKKNMGTTKFTALYQQSPVIEGGNIFKQEWATYYVDTPETAARLGLKVGRDCVILPRHFDQTVQSWDATFKSKENDDYVAGQTWSRRDAICYLRLGWCHKRLSFTETLDAIRAQSRMYPEATVKLVEDKANGPAIIDTLKREIPGIMPVSPGADSKEARAASVSPMWEARQVCVPHPKWHPEIQDWLAEIFGFPNMPHDDNVDSHVYALRRLNTKFNGPIVRY